MLQNINFTMPLYAPPVVIVTAKRVSNNSQSSGCDAIAAWVEVKKKKIKQVKLYNRLMPSSPCEQRLVLSS